MGQANTTADFGRWQSPDDYQPGPDAGDESEVHVVHLRSPRIVPGQGLIYVPGRGWQRLTRWQGFIIWLAGSMEKLARWHWRR